jgi:hypothetical protein
MGGIMKEPKTFKRPRLYMRDINNNEGWLSRLRIIYPDGTCEYTTAELFMDWKHPCWAKIGANPKLQVKRMKSYDKSLDCKTLFLGEL